MTNRHCNESRIQIPPPQADRARAGSIQAPLAFQISFAKRVPGRLALGYGAQPGLGVLMATNVMNNSTPGKNLCHCQE
jgi:hypothetical protein